MPDDPPHAVIPPRGYFSAAAACAWNTDPKGASGSWQGVLEHLHELSELGFTVAHGSLARVGTLRPLDLTAERVIPAMEKF